MRVCRLCANIRARGCAMAGKAGQIIPRGERIWLVRVFMWRDSESGNIRAHPGWFEEDAQDSRTLLAHSWSF